MNACFLKLSFFLACFAAFAVRADPIPDMAIEGTEFSEPVASTPDNIQDTGSISVTDAAPIPAALPGTLDEAASGFPSNVWQGSDSRTLVESLGKIDFGISENGIRDHVTRLLSTRAMAPQGNEANMVALTEARARALFTLGKDTEAAALLGAPSPEQHTPALNRFLTELAIFRKETLDCTTLSHDADTLRLRVLCHLAQNAPDEAQLTLDLAAEQEAPDIFLNELIAASRSPDVAITHYPAKPDLATLATVIHLGRSDTPPGYFDQAPVPLLVSIAKNERFSTEIRAVAAERATLYGALSPNELGSAYASVKAKDAGAKGIAASARLYQQQAAEKDPAKRARIIAEAIALMADANLREVAYALYAAPARELLAKHLGDLSPLARDGFAMLLLQGDTAGALDYLQHAAPADQLFLTAMGEALVAAKTSRIYQAPATLSAPTEPRDQRMLERLNTVLGPLGYALPLEVPVAAPTITRSESLKAFEAAEARQGEQMLLAALLIGKGGLGSMDGIALRSLVGALQKRYPDLARMIAVRAVVLTP